jgi:5-methylcytosine-specific restriction endonuclease McrBC GTP-binding regulatory subunit McrB
MMYSVTDPDLPSDPANIVDTSINSAWQSEWSEKYGLIGFVTANDVSDETGELIAKKLAHIAPVFKRISEAGDYARRDEPRNSRAKPLRTTNFAEFLRQEHFLYSARQIENYLLSLKVKPFVILTGNSGTGKTKLALLFCKYLEEKLLEDSSEMVVTTVKVGKSFDHEGWTFPKASFFEKYPNLRDYEGKRDIEVDGIKGTGRVELLTRLFYDSNPEISSRLEEIAKSDPAERVELKIHLPKRDGSLYAMVPVGANWTENRHIIGYHNAITGRYSTTKTLDLLLDAAKPQNQGIPHFLILDEMNLSHVERYFSDLLSAVESGEAIPLHTSDKVTDVPHDISVPQNLFIVGTVNVDETTYMFSPKVLDRANTIESEVADAKEYMSSSDSPVSLSGDSVYLENPMSDLQLRKMGISEIRELFKGVETIEGTPFWPELEIQVAAFQDALRSVHMEFGYRVINEMARFMYVAWKYEGSPVVWSNWRRYFDAQIMQKILPKIHGAQREVGGVIEDLFRLCFRGQMTIHAKDYKGTEPGLEVLYEVSALKLADMASTLDKQRYVSFTR